MLVPKLGSARAALLQLATRQTSDERGPCALADERAPCALAEVPKGAHVSRKLHKHGRMPGSRHIYITAITPGSARAHAW